MNLKDFKKVHEDNEKAVLKNGRGHSFTIAKKALHKDHLQKLKDLPLHASDGDYVEKPKEFVLGEDYSNAPMPGDQNASYLEKPDESPGYNEFTKPMGEGAFESPQAAQPVPSPSVAPSAPEADTSQPVPDEALVEPTPSKRSSSMAPPQPAGNAPAAEPPQPSAPQPDASSQAANQTYQNVYKKTYEDSVKRMAQDDVAWAQDLQNGHISPKTYSDLFADKSTPGKIGTLFGLLMSGMGSGLSGQPNAVLEMMNKEIDRDLEAQKQSKTNAVNYLNSAREMALARANVGKIGAETKYHQAATSGQLLENEFLSIKNKMLIASGHHVGQMVKNSTDPNAQKAAGMVNSGVMTEVAQNNDKMAQNEAAFKANNQSLRETDRFIPGNAALATANEAHHVTGYGDTNRAVSEKDHDEFNKRKEFHEAAKEYIDFANKYKYSLEKLNPIEREKIKNRAGALANNVQTISREMGNGGVWKKGEQEYLESLISSDPSKFTANIDAIPKMQQVMHDNERAAVIKAHDYSMSDFNGFDGGGAAPDQEVVNGYLVDHKKKKVIKKAK